jgi:cellulose synthase/poly-beta-1,6-N-acetylglucosamine synthase-like glycosyltransferase
MLFRKLYQKFKSRKTLSQLSREIEQLKEGLDLLKSRLDIDDTIYEKFNVDRCSTEYIKAFEEKEPLVSVCMPTFNRADLLISRSLPSILNQDYNNLEVIIVGDCCTDKTQELIEKIKDTRVKFLNLESRGHYPEDPMLRWLVAGTTPMNIALDMAKGSFITHLDDDDEYLLGWITRGILFL